MTHSLLVVGATSTIAEHLCRRLARSNARLHLLGRSQERLDAVAQDLRLRGAGTVTTAALEFTDGRALADAIDAAFRAAPDGFDWCLVAHGTMPDESSLATDVDAISRLLRDNAESAVLAGGRCALHLERQGRGALAFLGSVAGDRGRAHNATYGAAKAAVAAYASGLGQRLARSGVRVLGIRLGPVRTAMTAHLDGGPLWIGPERAAESIERALERRSGVVYCPGYWRPIMLAIRVLPDFVFNRMRF